MFQAIKDKIKRMIRRETGAAIRANNEAFQKKLDRTEQSVIEAVQSNRDSILAEIEALRTENGQLRMVLQKIDEIHETQRKMMDIPDYAQEREKLRCAVKDNAPEQALRIAKRLADERKKTTRTHLREADELRKIIMSSGNGELFADALKELFYLHSDDEFRYAQFADINAMRLPVMQAASLRKQFVRRRRMKQIGAVPERYLMFSKQAGEEFAQMAGMKCADSEGGYTVETLPRRDDIVIKPDNSHDSIGAYIVFEENRILCVESQRFLHSFDEMKQQLNEEVKNGRILKDSFVVQEAVYGNRRKKTPSHDLRFYTFYGEIPIITETVHIPADERDPTKYSMDYYQWFWDADGQALDLVKEKPPEENQPRGFTVEELEEVRRLSLMIPAPYLRIDYLGSEEGLVFDEFTGMTGRGIVIPELDFPSWDRKLGNEYLKAEMRLVNDLLEGKRFDLINEFNQKFAAGNPQKKPTITLKNVTLHE